MVSLVSQPGLICPPTHSVFLTPSFCGRKGGDDYHLFVWLKTTPCFTRNQQAAAARCEALKPFFLLINSQNASLSVQVKKAGKCGDEGRTLFPIWQRGFVWYKEGSPGVDRSSPDIFWKAWNLNMGTFLPTWAPLPFWNSLLLFYQPVFNLLLWPALTVTSTQSKRRGWGGERENKQKGGWGSAERRGRERIEAGGGAFKKIALCFVGSCWSCSGIAVKLLCGTYRVQVGKEMSGGGGGLAPAHSGCSPRRAVMGNRHIPLQQFPTPCLFARKEKQQPPKKEKKN